MKNLDTPITASRVDKVGVVCSTLCVIHCAFCSLAPSMLSVLGMGVFVGLTAEWGFTAAAVLLALQALRISWKHHRNLYLIALFITGSSGLCLGRLVEELDNDRAGFALSIGSGLILIAAHVAGRVLSRRRVIHA